MEYNLNLEKIIWNDFALLRECEYHFKRNLPVNAMEFYNLANRSYKTLKNTNYYSPTLFALEQYKDYVFMKYIDKHVAMEK